MASHGRQPARGDGPVAGAFHEWIEIAIGEIVDDAAGRTHGDRAQHEDDQHLGRRMRGAGDPHGPEHRPEQQPDADGAMQARDFDEIANAPPVAHVGQPRVRRRRGEIQVGERLVSHWRASYTRGGVSARAARELDGNEDLRGLRDAVHFVRMEQRLFHGFARGAVQAVVTARAFHLDLRGAADSNRPSRAARRCRARACASIQPDTRARARARIRPIRPWVAG